MTMSDNKPKTVSLVLGSGAARGLAHIGVIDALEEKGYDIISIAGCSIGSIVGAAYASGNYQAFRQWALELTRLETFRLIDFSFASGGAIKGDKLFSKLSELIGDPNIEDLPLDFTAIATDLVHQKEFWFQKGSLINAIRASSAIPSLIVPVRLNDNIYVDGGLLNPLPIIPTIASNADYIIAVDLNGRQAMPQIEALATSDSTQVEESDDWMSSLKDMFKYSFVDTAEDIDDKIEIKEQHELANKGVSPEHWGRLQIVNSMFETMQASLTQYKVAGYPPNAVISLSKDACSFYEFWRANEMVEYGYQETLKALKKPEYNIS